MSSDSVSAATSNRREQGVFMPLLSSGAAPEWRGRLVIRPYLEETALVRGPELSVRVEHAGESYYFPLGVMDRSVAATRAAELENVVRRQGWAAAKGRFPREITLACFWTASPLTCTYTSLYSVPGEIPEIWRRHRASGRKRCRVGIVEADASVRKAAAFWVDRQPGFFCAGEFSSISEALRTKGTGLLLVDRALMEQPGGVALDQIRRQLPGVNVFGFGIYEESNYIFHSVTGVKSGYVLCRRPPGRLFEPIRFLANHPRTAEALSETEILDHFRRLFGKEQECQDGATFAKLTPREHEVVAALTRGFSEKEVASALGISTLTVHNHVKKIYAKFDVHSRSEIILKYLGR